MARNVSLITLDEATASSLTSLLQRGKLGVRTYRRIQILLDLQTQPPTTICENRGVSLTTVYNVKNAYLSTNNYKSAIYDAPRSGAPPKIDGKARAKITALACSDAPIGHRKWTLQMLADKAVELKFVDEISRSSVRTVLKKTKFAPISKPTGV
jgi:putative transposase